MRLSFIVLPIVLGLVGSFAHAQNVPVPLVATRPNESQEAALIRIQRLYRYGLNREVVDTATLTINKNKTAPDPKLFYWRGMASRRIYLLDAAKRDLEPLGEYTPDYENAPATEILTKVNDLLRKRPPLKAVVRSSDGKTVLFRVYSPDDDEFLHTIVTDLSLGYKEASTFTGIKTNEVPIFVFNTARHPEAVKFKTSFMGRKDILTWERSVTQSGTITFTQRSEDNPDGRTANDPRLLRTVTHEITHQLVRGLVGSDMDMPNWFSEGIAQFCEGRSNPRVYTQNDATMQKLVDQEALLSLSQIEGNKDFHDNVTKQYAGEQKGSPYAQGLSMTRYLFTLIKDENIPNFLQSIRKKLSFDTALSDATGLDKDEFYAAWKKTLPPSTL